MKNPQSYHRNYADFKVGDRVKVICHGQDFNFFRGDETGEVVRNGGRYLSIIVRFDEPRGFRDGYIQREFGFTPSDLIHLDEEKFVTDISPGIKDEQEWDDLKGVFGTMKAYTYFEPEKMTALHAIR